jgi:TonB family protein
VTLKTLNRLFAVGLLLFGGWAAISCPMACGQEKSNRKVKNKVAPTYPDLAKHINLAGVVRVEITVAPNGSIKSARLIGGHPVLGDAALDAVRKWKYEAGPQESTDILEFRFDPHQ